MGLPKLLVVEDDVNTSKLICEIIMCMGYHPTAAFDGEDGLNKARELKYDLILTDILMPKLNGIELCRELKNDEKTKDIPVIVVTKKNDLLTKVDARAIGAQCYITKPFNIDDFICTVERTLRKQKVSEAGI